MHPFINRLLCFMLAIVLVVALAVPVFAAERTDYISLFNERNSDNYDISGYPYLVVHEYSISSGTAYYYYFFTNTFTEGTDGKFTTNGAYLEFDIRDDYQGGKVCLNSSGTSFTVEPTFFDDPAYIDNALVPFDGCDGTSCPATDANHDNVCDDCGKVLAYNLRSTLLDFAKAHAATFSYQKYFAVLQHPTEDNKYNVFLSSTPMYANSPDYTTAYGTDMLWLQVWENEDGTFSYTGENTVYKMTDDPDNLVYANHNIENFTAPPLAVKIQGVSGEALMMELPNLIAEAKTIVICGVGCLALLIVLPLLSKKLKPFLTR